MINTRRHRIAFTVATLGATAGLMVFAVPLVPQVGANLDNAVLSEMGMRPEMPVPHVMRYGAIAYAPSGASGTSQGHPVKAQAEQVALQKCGDPGCRVIISFNLCGAVASDGSNYQGGRGFSRAAAETDALNRLGGGKIVNSVCN
ncbi:MULTISPECIES: DUF4189 domain-containing protein [Mycobacterium]|jgi:hypothetical protein|uniref:DUF4189 domain-containing protein n=1 Tax=Mycobacterium kiyosense TaxID=2871094 RepID=A0AA37PXS0_9MYCO|nr:MULTISPECIES: DUF4189 domain-containing protein [Mycobacterium]BDE17273.1 hypothetical protein MKCMC460_61330 [Mycobacterium sp. 20KCMC460]GLB86366.1 hypothetical protein SRL2020028_56220 [Mycobacterium kiyosense]GLB91764.1 hypothetical protein SRL2020130_45810 [Mycobacterium kiyosense]GLB98807.1 hypothetical protein SRL2020226_55830 [Mycobacterium kiyosense]GLC05129.1 hypothetical protein SRL2020400_57200 [Mycobacterium kiyosense]